MRRVVHQNAVKNIFLFGDRDSSSDSPRFDAAIGLLPSGVTARWVGTDSPDAVLTRTRMHCGWSRRPYRNDAAVSGDQLGRTSGQPFWAPAADSSMRL